MISCRVFPFSRLPLVRGGFAFARVFQKKKKQLFASLSKKLFTSDCFAKNLLHEFIRTCHHHYFIYGDDKKTIGLLIKKIMFHLSSFLYMIVMLCARATLHCHHHPLPRALHLWPCQLCSPTGLFHHRGGRRHGSLILPPTPSLPWLVQQPPRSSLIVQTLQAHISLRVQTLHTHIFFNSKPSS